MATPYGDIPFPLKLSETQRGKHQVLVGTDNENNSLYGDAWWINDSAKGGNDEVTAGRQLRQR
jgi:hypothetical protein